MTLWLRTMASTTLVLLALFALAIGVYAACDAAAYSDNGCVTKTADIVVPTDKCTPSGGSSSLVTYDRPDLLSSEPMLICMNSSYSGNKVMKKIYATTDCTGNFVTIDRIIGQCYNVQTQSELFTRCPASANAVPFALLALAALVAVASSAF